MSQFAGKVALVTGGTSGIGRATAVLFAKHGAAVVVTGRREKEGNETVRLVEAAGGKGKFVKADAAVEADVERTVNETLAAFGRLDFAFNNAGIEQEPSPLTEQSGELFDRVMTTNVKGVWLAMKHEIPAMLKTGGGAVVNNASIAGTVGMAQIPIYIASKHAVVGLTKAVALEYAKQGVRVNGVGPGAIDTAMFDRFAAANPQVRDAVVGMHPIGRVGTPDEIADAVVWLCSPGAAFVVGQTLFIDGGFTVG